MATSLATVAERLEAGVYREPMSGCWLWTEYTNDGGYGQMRIGGRRAPLTRAHRASWEAANGPIPDDLCVLHRCDVRCCVNPAHLFLGTRTDNLKDMHQKGRGRGPSGERNHNAKLSVEKIVSIRRALAQGETQAALAKKYGVSGPRISNIATGKAWRGVTCGD